VSYIDEVIRRNPERLSIQERDEREAKQVAVLTGRYITRDNGEIIHNKKFIDGYVKLIQD